MARSRFHVAVTLVALLTVAIVGCSGAGESAGIRPIDTNAAATARGGDLSTTAAPEEVAFVDLTGDPSNRVVAAAAPVHSAPDDLYTRIGEIAPGDLVGLTGRRVTHEGGTWLEIIWKATTAWISVEN